MAKKGFQTGTKASLCKLHNTNHFLFTGVQYNLAFRNISYCFILKRYRNSGFICFPFKLRPFNTFYVPLRSIGIVQSVLTLSGFWHWWKDGISPPAEVPIISTFVVVASVEFRTINWASRCPMMGMDTAAFIAARTIIGNTFKQSYDESCTRATAYSSLTGSAFRKNQQGVWPLWEGCLHERASAIR